MIYFEPEMVKEILFEIVWNCWNSLKLLKQFKLLKSTKIPNFPNSIVIWRKLISRAQGQGSSRLWWKALDLLLSLPLPHTFLTILPLGGKFGKQIVNVCWNTEKMQNSFFSTRIRTRMSYTNTETAVGETGVDTTGKFPPVSRARFPTGDCPFTYFGSGANRGPSCANTRGNTSRLQLTQIPNPQNWCKMYAFYV